MEMYFAEDRVSAGYKIVRSSGVQDYTGLTFDIVRDKGSKKASIRFLRNGLERHTEPISSLSADTWENAVDSIVYVRQ